jgi:hypothetical protein
MSAWVLMIMLLSNDHKPIGVAAVPGWHLYEDCEAKGRY